MSETPEKKRAMSHSFCDDNQNHDARMQVYVGLQPPLIPYNDTDEAISAAMDASFPSSYDI